MNKNFCPSEVVAKAIVLLLLGHNAAERGARAASPLGRHHCHGQLQAGFAPATVTKHWLQAQVCQRKATKNGSSSWSWAGVVAEAGNKSAMARQVGFGKHEVLQGLRLSLHSASRQVKFLLHSPGTGCKERGEQLRYHSVMPGLKPNK